MRWLDSITNSIDMNLSKLQETVSGEQRSAAVHGVAELEHDLVTKQQPPHSTHVSICL